MCFGFRKKVLRRQEEILKKLEEAEQANRAGREAITTAMSVSNTALIGGIKTTLDAVVGNVDIMRKTNETRIAEVNATLDKNLSEIRFNMEKSLKDVREDNEKQLGAMRNVVEQKLTETLGERLSSTFNAINERLDAVNKGLGEMQSLNNGVTDLRKVLSNVKTRGIWGEVSLENLLDGILTREQYVVQKNVSGKRNGEAERGKSLSSHRREIPVGGLSETGGQFGIGQRSRYAGSGKGVGKRHKNAGKVH